jgi:hypothetical protein
MRRRLKAIVDLILASAAVFASYRETLADLENLAPAGATSDLRQAQSSIRIRCRGVI